MFFTFFSSIVVVVLFIIIISIEAVGNFIITFLNFLLYISTLAFYGFVWGLGGVLFLLLLVVQLLSCVQLFVTPWTVARLAPLSMGFPRQEYWSGFPFPSPGDLPDPEIEPASPA